MKKYIIKLVLVLLVTWVAFSGCSLQYRQNHRKPGQDQNHNHDRDHDHDRDRDHHYDSPRHY